MATDGLWDRLENDTVCVTLLLAPSKLMASRVALVGAWLDGHKDTISENDLLQRVSIDKQSKVATSHVPRNKRNGQFVFEDANLSTHLIRNALGGADQQCALTSI
jgi:pyruvate dehydrogenase phosphatase